MQAAVDRWSWFLVVLTTGCGDPFGCGERAHCEVETGRYLALLPADWRGAGDLPAVVHFHGYGGSARALADKASFTQPLLDQRVIAVYPDGVDGSWSNVGSPHRDRDEQAFVRQVLDDVRERFPVDEGRILMSGFSHGSGVAWDVACYQPELVSAFAPVSGAFWEPLPASCMPAGQRLRHEHGTADGVYPMEGRPIADTRQGAVRASVDRLVKDGACAEPQVVEEEGRTCEVWGGCADGG